MSCGCNRNRICPDETVVDPVQTIYRDQYHPQLVRVVHPVEIVTRHHCFPVRCDVYKVFCRNEFVGGPEEGVPYDNDNGYANGAANGFANNYNNAYENNRVMENGVYGDFDRPTISRKKPKKSSKKRSKK
ncbi:hypothetical protein M3223_08140 [Paenibacillus pasadenensis]|uniref:hypothetical protein n=1 Tax=Paenibacillus pasadenensis TaxID=217090 RepID=UPI002041CD12|nr:hypothetical protein [Paenibacillus pasadenensis]MCM3747323.1 hypothetical protein [Paenibacillus pasadenensis]